MSAPRRDLALVLTLTLCTGVVDAVSYFSLDHVFTANMSGNMALVGVGLATDVGAFAGNVFALLGFAVGAVVGARLFRRSHLPKPRLLHVGLSVELGLLVVLAVVVGAVDVGREDAVRYAVAFVLAVAMGIQTGISRLLAVSDVNTTVATMTLHDLAAQSPFGGQPAVRWRRRLGVVACLVVGAAAGVGLDRLVPWGGLALCSVIVAAVLVASLVSRGRS